MLFHNHVSFFVCSDPVHMSCNVVLDVRYSPRHETFILSIECLQLNGPLEGACLHTPGDLNEVFNLPKFGLLQNCCFHVGQICFMVFLLDSQVCHHIKSHLVKIIQHRVKTNVSETMFVTKLELISLASTNAS